MISVPKDVQEKIIQFEQLRKQLQVVTTQRMQLEGELEEMKETLKVLSESDEDAAVYRNVGNLMILVKDRKKLLAELNENIETLELRVKTMKSQEERLKERFEALQKDITDAINTIQGGAMGGALKTG